MADIQSRIDEAAERADINIGDELALWGSSISSGSQLLPGQIQGYGLLAGGVLSILGMLFGANKSKQAKQSADVTADIVKSVDALLDSVPTDAASVAKAALKKSQTSATRKAVADIKSK